LVYGGGLGKSLDGAELEQLRACFEVSGPTGGECLETWVFQLNGHDPIIGMAWDRNVFFLENGSDQ
jgi:hypothetical protein